MRVLVTGGFGYLGSWLVEHGLRQGWKMSVLAARPRPTFQPGKVEVLQCDLRDAAATRHVLEGRIFDGVVHTACASRRPDRDYFVDAFAVNTLGTRSLLAALDLTSLGQFIYLSTAHVYGRVSGVVTEQTTPQPLDDYATTHWLAEEVVRQFARTRGLRQLCFRLTNAYGCPLDAGTSQWSLLLNDAARQAWETGEIKLLGNGLAWRDFVWLGDVCEVLGRSLAGDIEGTFNLAASKSLRILEVAEKVARAARARLGREVPVVPNMHDRSTPGDPPVFDTTRLQSALPFTVHDRLEEEAGRIFSLLEGTGATAAGQLPIG